MLVTEKNKNNEDPVNIHLDGNKSVALPSSKHSENAREDFQVLL